MRIPKITILLGVAFFAFLHNSAWAVVPVTVLGEKADVVLLGNVLEMSGEDTGGVRIQVQPTLVLKGQLPLSQTSVILRPSGLMQQNAGRQVISRSVTGLWFLTEKSNGVYEVIPTEQGNYTESAAFVPVPDWWVPAVGVSLSQQLLSAAVVSYQSLPDPSGIDEGKLLVSLENTDPNEALTLIAQLMTSPNIDQQVMGFTAAIRMGSDEAIVQLAQQMGTLRFSKKFDRIIRALGTYYRPNGNNSIPALRQLAELRSDIPGLDVAVGKALQKIETKEVLPVMALLLESSDPLAQNTSAWFFHFYTALAGPDGNINRSGDGKHPFWTEDTRRYAPRRDSGITTAEYASFWKSWWAQHGTELGFSAP